MKRLVCKNNSVPQIFPLHANHKNRRRRGHREKGEEGRASKGLKPSEEMSEWGAPEKSVLAAKAPSKPGSSGVQDSRTDGEGGGWGVAALKC